MNGGLRAGTSWQSELYAAFDGQPPMVTLVLATQPWLASAVCREELALAMSRAAEGAGALCMLPVVGPLGAEHRRGGPNKRHPLEGSVEDILLPPHAATCDASWHEACVRTLRVLDGCQRADAPNVAAVRRTELECARFALRALSLEPPGRAPSLPPGHSQAHVQLVHADADRTLADDWARALSAALDARRALGAVRRATTAIEVDSAQVIVICVLSDNFAFDPMCESLLQVSIMRQRSEGGALLSVSDAAAPLSASCPRYLRLQPRLRLLRGSAPARTPDDAALELTSAAELVADALVTRLRLRESQAGAGAPSAQPRHQPPADVPRRAGDQDLAHQDCSVTSATNLPALVKMRCLRSPSILSSDRAIIAIRGLDAKNARCLSTKRQYRPSATSHQSALPYWSLIFKR